MVFLQLSSIMGLRCLLIFFVMLSKWLFLRGFFVEYAVALVYSDIISVSTTTTLHDILFSALVLFFFFFPKDILI